MNANMQATGKFSTRVLFLSTVFILAFAFNTTAHEMRPAYLQLRQTSMDAYELLWKVPVLGPDRKLALYVRLPEGSSNLTKPQSFFSEDAFTEKWNVKPGAGTIFIEGLSATLTDVLVRVERLDGTTQVTRLTPSSPSFVLEEAPRKSELAAMYLWLGIEHIVSGIDHLLFVLALLIITHGSWRLVKTITAFTIAHSITLALATLGVVHVPQRPVETTIALSIVFVALEIVYRREGKTGLTERYPWLIAFLFGLLHGFGFAGALSSVGLPQQAIPVALLFFNFGVEIGQLFFIASMFVIFALSRRTVRAIALPHPPWMWRIPPYAIGSLATFWVIQRLLG